MKIVLVKENIMVLRYLEFIWDKVNVNCSCVEIVFFISRWITMKELVIYCVGEEVGNR